MLHNIKQRLHVFYNIINVWHQILHTKLEQEERQDLFWSPHYPPSYLLFVIYCFFLHIWMRNAKHAYCAFYAFIYKKCNIAYVWSELHLFCVASQLDGGRVVKTRKLNSSELDSISQQWTQQMAQLWIWEWFCKISQVDAWLFKKLLEDWDAKTQHTVSRDDVFISLLSDLIFLVWASWWPAGMYIVHVWHIFHIWHM